MAKKRPHKADGSMKLLDAIAELVHQGYGRMLDACAVYEAIGEWHPNCCANYEYVFAWNPDFHPDSLQVNWKRPNRQILRRVVKRTVRIEKILDGSPMTKMEQQAYRLELARQKHGYVTAQERLESGTGCQWVDLSYATDSKGRRVYILEMGEPDETTDEELEAMPPEEFISWHKRVWEWKRAVSFFGPFASEEEAEEWMAQNGAFDDDE